MSDATYTRAVTIVVPVGANRAKKAVKPKAKSTHPRTAVMAIGYPCH